jgi:hypothetical protein
MPSKVKVVEQYHNYSPPIDVYGSVRLLLRFVPPEHLVGLQKVVLTNSEEVGKQIRGKIPTEGRRIKPADCAGLYSKGRVLLLIDRIFQQYPELCLLVPPFTTYVIGEILYHEIGHHIHRLEQPGYRANKEAVADQWKEQLLRGFLRQRYWYLAKLVRFFSMALNPIAMWLKRA